MQDNKHIKTYSPDPAGGGAGRSMTTSTDVLFSLRARTESAAHRPVQGPEICRERGFGAEWSNGLPGWYHIFT